IVGSVSSQSDDPAAQGSALADATPASSQEAGVVAPATSSTPISSEPTGIVPSALPPTETPVPATAIPPLPPTTAPPPPTTAPPPTPPAARPPPPATAPPPPPPSKAFGDGTFVVGSDIRPGTYRASRPSSFCYWERLSGFGGTLDEIIANEASSSGPELVTIAASDAGFTSRGCGGWSADLSPITASPDSPFGDGKFLVGVDIAPGTWRSNGAENCYWERLAGFGGTLEDIVANDLPS